MQLVIFLYLLDNETSTVVLFSAGIGTLIEFWKVTKAMKVSIDWSRGFPLPKFEDKAGVTCMLCLYCRLCISETKPLITVHSIQQKLCVMGSVEPKTNSGVWLLAFVAHRSSRCQG